MELRQYIAVIRKYWWLILLTTTLATAAAFYVSATAPPVYQATTTLEVNLGASPLSDPYSVSNVRTLESAAEIFSAKIQFSLFLQEVKDRLGLPLDVEIEEMISVQQIGSTQLIRITAESNDPALAQALADTVTRVLIERETSQQQVRFQAGLTELEAQIAALDAAVTETQASIAALGNPENTLSEFVRLERSRLESQLTRDQTRLVVLLASAEEFRLAMARYTDNVTIYAPAELPSKPVGSRTMQNTLLGAVTGLMIGVGVAFLLEYLDDTIKSPEDVKQTLPVGVLGALPRLKEMDSRLALVVAEYPLRPISEAFRNLRTSIQFSSLDQPARTLLVTSPLPSDGKTFTAANLAVVMAQGGKSVVVVDADLRHPTLHRMFGMPKEPGLTAALLSPDERAHVIRQTEVKGLRIVTSGSNPPNPAELLASERMHEFIAWLVEEEADVVIIDSPPVLAVTDAAVLSTQVDGTLLIFDCGETRKPAAAQAVERLMSVGGKVLGVVLNRMSASGDGYYYSYYSGDSARENRKPWIARLLKSGRSKRPRDKGTRGGGAEVQG